MGKYFWKNTMQEQKMKAELLIGFVLAFVSVMLVIAVLLLGLLDIGDKWYEWKDDLIVIASFICLMFLVLSYTFFMSVGIDATNAEKDRTIKGLQLDLERLKNNG